MNRVSKHKGFNLVELMVVVAIVGILASIGYPLYTDQMQRTRRADGKAMLLEVMEAQERSYSATNTYVTTLASLSYPVGTVLSEKGFYQISAVACLPGPLPLNQCVDMTATPVAGGPQAADGPMSIDTRNIKSPASYW